jgi:hypothetical protein
VCCSCVSGSWRIRRDSETTTLTGRLELGAFSKIWVSIAFLMAVLSATCTSPEGERIENMDPLDEIKAEEGWIGGTLQNISWVSWRTAALRAVKES